ncbi:MAG: glycine cleavage system aminomethyltransferase GcvT [Candidatus Omnitrophica bacterium]|nr:glycine cleavage system aminomethyltransferase GcvT [Candidatus Omnitrophota bacterium]
MELKTTPLINEHKKLGAKLAPFGGWLMPINYSSIIEEHNWTRSSCSIFDICHMGEFIIEGKPEEVGLDNILTVNLSQMPSGRCRYGFMLNDKGGVIDDLIVYKINDTKWMLVVNAATTDKDQSHIKKYLSGDYRFENMSECTAKLDLQGPESAQVLKSIAGDKIEDLSYYTFGTFSILGEDCIVSRTGYTGELGYEIYISADKAKALWDIVLKDKRVRPAGLGARDTLRLEMGYVLYGQDIDETTSPIEALKEKHIDFGKNFIGKEALLKQKDNGVKRNLVGFISDTRRSPRHDYKAYSGDKEIGTVTSGSFSPSLSCGIGMGYVLTEYNEVGQRITIKNDNIQIESKIVDKPFYKNINPGERK